MLRKIHRLATQLRNSCLALLVLGLSTGLASADRRPPTPLDELLTGPDLAPNLVTALLNTLHE